jgi:DNA-binding winged helix-turn-helix (wHTH) protein
VTFRFDTFVLDEGSRQLLRGAGDVHLSPKAFDLLLHLIRTRPRAVSKTELHDHLWPDTFVTDASLGMLVTEIRTALGDKARRPRFVRTVHRFGYAFQGDVTEISDLRRTARAGIVCWLVSATRQFMLEAGENMVGRDPRAAVWLDSPGISRHHARITVEASHVLVEDLGSKNGTHVRGQPVIEPTPLADGDEIRFGSMSLMFRVWGSSGSTASEA